MQARELALWLRDHPGGTIEDHQQSITPPFA
jgi:hypothetical protein